MSLSCGKDKYQREIVAEYRSVVCASLALFPAGNATGRTLVKINFAFGRMWVGSDILLSALIKCCKERKKRMCNFGGLIDEGCLNTAGASRGDKRGIFAQGAKVFCRTQCTLDEGESTVKNISQGCAANYIL